MPLVPRWRPGSGSSTVHDHQQVGQPRPHRPPPGPPAAASGRAGGSDIAVPVAPIRRECHRAPDGAAQHRGRDPTHVPGPRECGRPVRRRNSSLRSLKS
jgi:hypothetical protein